MASKLLKNYGNRLNFGLEESRCKKFLNNFFVKDCQARGMDVEEIDLTKKGLFLVLVENKFTIRKEDKIQYSDLTD